MKTILVGNGPSAIEKKNGHLIDQFDIVIRFNKFYTIGFEEYVGIKTDIWVVNLGYIAYPTSTDIKWGLKSPIPKTIVFVPWTLELYPNYLKIKEMNFPDNTRLCSEKTAKKADNFYTGKIWASTGLMAIMEFAPCYIVGFDCFSGKDHHYVKDEAKNTFHSPEIESKFVEEMVEKGLVTRL